MESLFLKKNVWDILDRFQMKDYNPISTKIEFNLKLNKDHLGKVENIVYKKIVGSTL